MKGAALNRLIARLDRRLARPARDAAVRVDEGTITVVPSRDGRRVRVTRLRALLSRLPQRLTVPVAPVPPAIGDAAARAARNRAERITQGPVRVAGAGRALTIPHRTLVRALRFTPDDDAIAVGLDSDALVAVLTDTFGDLEREPVSADFRVAAAASTWCRDAPARSIDARRSCAPSHAEPDPVRCACACARWRRRSTTAAARRMPHPRGGRAVHDAVLHAASRVSPTSSAAPPTSTARSSRWAARSRSTRPRRAHHRPRLRGGAADQRRKLEGRRRRRRQSDRHHMYNAAFFAGLDLVSHTPHEFWITRYPPGREATVSWGGPELIVRNDWDAAVLIKVSPAMTASPSGCTRRSSAGGSPPLQRQRRAGTAFTITYTRKVYRGDELLRDEDYSWTYREPPARQ